MLNPITRRALTSKVRLCDQLKHEKDELIVWWYGGIIKNYKAESVPKVVVFFRRLDKNGNLGSFERKDIALTFLGLLRIGSIWKEGECRSEAVFPTEQKQFEVDFTHGAWRFVCPSQAAKLGIEKIINQSDYPLHFAKDKNWLINFPLSNDQNLLIPCTEFFVRNYGRSEEVPRVLATYGWEEVHKRFYVPFDQPVVENTWPVKLKSRMYNGDVVFLAHMKYDPYTAFAAKGINAQIETSFLNKEPYAFIQAGPWFEGKAQVLVSGHWINEGKTFLALRFLGGSDPQEVPIQRDRENSNKTDGALSSEVGESTGGRPPRPIKKPAEIVDLTDQQEPDHGAASVEVEEPDFIVLGKPRDVFDVNRNKKTNSRGKPRDGGVAKIFSSGESYGSSKGVGFASIHAPVVMKLDGTLLDVWDAMLYLKKEKSELIQSVEWFTFEDGFSSNPEPKLIALLPFDKAEKVETKTRNWLYFDTASETPRGILVTRLMVCGKSVFILEIQRRPRMKKDDEGNAIADEESFAGLVFLLNDHSQFEMLLRVTLSKMRHVRGIIKNLLAGLPNSATDFRHSTANSEKVPGEAAVMNALSKIGLVEK